MRTKWTRFAARAAARSSVRGLVLGSVRGVLANRAAPPRDQCNSADTAGTIASARAPRQPGPLARRRAPRAGWKCADQRLCDAAWHALRARLVERHGVTRYRFSRTEAAERRARCPQGEPSAMLPAVSAALAERSPEGHRGASKRSIQTPRSGRFKRLGAVNANVNEGVVGRVVRGPGRRRRTADRTGSRGPSRAEGRVHRARRGAPRRCDRGTNGHDRS